MKTKTKISVGVEELTAILEILLGGHPSRSGKRLCSERELASRLNIDRMKIQKAYDALVERGILARRHGSGTYVRKVPRLSDPSAKAKLGDQNIHSAELFAESSQAVIPRQISKEHKKLQLAVVLNQMWKSNSNDNIFAGIKDRTQHENHSLKMVGKKGTLLDESDPALIQALQASTADGFILWATYGKAFHAAFPDLRPPVVFIGSLNRETDIEFSPLVRIDLEEASIRGLQLLGKAGHKRIGFIGFKSKERHWNQDEILYDKTMQEMGSSYRSTGFCSLAKGDAKIVAKSMFATSERPDAVYVADDIVLAQILPVWKSMGIIPGQNLGVITLSACGNPLPQEFKWSRLEFNPFQTGRMAVDSLLLEIESAAEQACSFAHLAEWHPGETH